MRKILAINNPPNVQSLVKVRFDSLSMSVCALFLNSSVLMTRIWAVYDKVFQSKMYRVVRVLMITIHDLLFRLSPLRAVPGWADLWVFHVARCGPI